MGYAREFNHLEYNVPEFLLKESAWEDCSWHNDVCPRWENRELGLAVWVDCQEPECREYDDWAQYTVVKLIWTGINDDPTALGDDIIFQTEVQHNLKRWLACYETLMHLDNAFISAGKIGTEEGFEIADELAEAIARVKEVMSNIQDYEVPDCSPAGEPM